jgi:hypothetical protein
VEVALHPVSPLSLYYDETDHRFHLSGATEGWLHVDFDLDGQTDTIYAYRDDDQDGCFDRREIDLDADGRPEFDWPMGGARNSPIELQYDAIMTAYRGELREVLDASQRFIDAAKTALGLQPASAPAAIERFFLKELPLWQTSTSLGARIRGTPAGARFYTDLVRDHLLYALQQVHGKANGWPEIESVYASGDYARAADLLDRLSPEIAPAIGPRRFASFDHRIPVHIDNTGGPHRERWPITLRLKELRSVAEDFRPRGCAVVAPDRWIDWRPVPHQIDQLDPAIGPELSFLVDLPADGETTWYVYYGADAPHEPVFAARTAATATSTGGTWESTFATYLCDGGRFSFLGRTQYRHSSYGETLTLPAPNKASYSQLQTGEEPRALLAGACSGLGGPNLYFGDHERLVFEPGRSQEVTITYRVLTDGPVRAAVETRAEGFVAPARELRLRVVSLVYAGHAESEVRVSVEDAPDSLFIAPGVVKLEPEQAFLDLGSGVFASWGYQETGPEEVGLGLVWSAGQMPELLEFDAERRFLCRAPDGRSRYWIVGDWQPGRRFPVAPNGADWSEELRALAERLQCDVRVGVGPSEPVR